MADLISHAAQGYAEAHTSPLDGDVGRVAAATREGLSSFEMMSGLAEARLLELLIVTGNARRVLEIGTFTGVGAIAMASALPEDGRLTTLEVDADNAALARRNIMSSAVADRIELIVGNALETLARLDGPFDLVYIDAWKNDYPAYYDLALPKLAPGGVIVADNLFLGGRVLDAEVSDERTPGIREFARRVQADARVHNVLLTIGDGVMLAWRPA